MKLLSYMILAVAVAMVCGGGTVAHAYVVLEDEQWDDGANYPLGDPAWGSDEGYVTEDHSTGDGAGYLDIGYDAGRNAGGEAVAVVYTAASDFFAGNWRELSEEDGAWMEFDFWADENVPLDLELRFEGTSGDVWRYDFSTDDLGSGWSGFYASLTYDESLWYYGTANDEGEATFLDDLFNIDWIGVYIYDQGTADNNYGLDDWQLMVPEPAEYALAVSALMVVWLSVRRKRKQAIVQAA